MTYWKCKECGRIWLEEVPLNYERCPFCEASPNFERVANPSKTDLPDQKEILRYLSNHGGSSTNDEMYREKLGDVGRGWDTIQKLKKLADEGKVRREIQHIFQGGRCVRTIIRWSSVS